MKEKTILTLMVVFGFLLLVSSGIFIYLLGNGESNINKIEETQQGKTEISQQNVKVYDPIKNEITIKNKENPTQEFFKGKLITPQINHVGAGKDILVAEIELTNFDKNVNNAFDTIQLYNTKENNLEFSRDIIYKYQKVIGQKEVLYQNNCVVIPVTSQNGSQGYDRQCETKTKTQDITEWKIFNSVSELPDGIVRIGLFTDVERGERVEWIPTWFGARIDEWAEWSAELNTNLVAYWKLNETTGNPIESVSGRNGTIVGGVEQGALGLINGSYNFTGAVTTYANLTDLGGLTNVTGNFSYSFWFNSTGAIEAESQQILHVGTTTDNVIAVGLTGASNDYQISSTLGLFGGGNLQNRFRFPSNYTWIHAVVTYNESTWSLYINGTFANSTASSTAITNGQELKLGNGNVPNLNRGFRGLVDEVGFWNRTLEVSEVTQLYNEHLGITQNPLALPLTSNLTITLIAPSDNAININLTLNFTANIQSSSTVNNTNATAWIYFNNGSLFNNSVTNDITSANGTINNTNLIAAGFTPNIYIWNVFGCGINQESIEICNFASANRTLTTEQIITEENFSQTTTEGNNEFFQLNVTIPESSTITIANLFYNNTFFTGTVENTGGDNRSLTRNLVIPFMAQQESINFFWSIIYSNGFNSNTTTRTQTVNDISIDDCSSNTILVVNYSAKDEGDLSNLNSPASNVTIEIDLDIFNLGTKNVVSDFSQTYNHVNITAPARVCVDVNILNNTNYRLDSEVRYTANDYVVEFHNIQNFTLSNDTIPQNIELFPLKTADSQEFLINFKDENFLPVKDALISITRKYVGEGLFRTVEAPLSNNDGQVISHMVLGDIIYTIQVAKNGRILGTFPNIIPFCTNLATGECIINLNSFTSGTSPENFQTRNNLSYDFIFDAEERTLTVTFLTLDGSSSLINLTGTVFDNRGNITACTTSITTSAGSIICEVPLTIGNSTIRGNLYKDGQFVAYSLFSLSEAVETGFGATGIIILAIMYITIPLMMITSGPGIIIGAILGLIFGGLLNLYTGGNIIGATSTIIWFIIAGGIILWKINQSRST